MAALCYAATFDPFLSLDCAPRPPPRRNPRKGRDQILPSGNNVQASHTAAAGRTVVVKLDDTYGILSLLAIGLSGSVMILLAEKLIVWANVKFGN